MRQMLERWETQHGLDTLTQRSRRGVIGSYVALLALLCYGGLGIQNVGEGSLASVLVRVLPLILFLPSIIGKSPRGHAWLAFVSLLYFMQGVMIATLPGYGLFGMLEIIATLSLFIFCTGYARFRSRQIRQSQSL